MSPFLGACAMVGLFVYPFIKIFPPPPWDPLPSVPILKMRNVNKDQDKIFQVRSYRNLWPYKRYVQGEWR